MVSDDNPFEPPGSDQRLNPTNEDTGQKPSWWHWYVIYCSGMALIYLGCLVFGITLINTQSELGPADGGVAVSEDTMLGVMLLVLGAALGILYIGAIFVPRSNVGWIIGLVAIGIGLTSLCFLPFSLPLLLGWINDKTRRYFRA